MVSTLYIDMAKKVQSTPPASSPLPHILNGVFFIIVVLLAGKLYMVSTAPKMNKNDQQEVKIPSDAVKITECLPKMGEHWVEPANIPAGPYYVTYKGKVLALEYMIKPEEIPGEKQARMNLPQFEAYLKENNLTFGDYMSKIQLSMPLPSLAYKTVHFDWSPAHPGLITPHYDVHFYLVSDEELENVCPDARTQDAYSPEVLEGINKNNIPFPSN
jgi:hypothetical protein